MSRATVEQGAQRPFFDAARVGQGWRASAHGDAAGAKVQPVSIHGRACELRAERGGWVVRCSGRVLARAPQRLLAVALAAAAVREVQHA